VSRTEEHQGSIDWVLEDPDPELGTIDPSLMTSRRADVSPALAPTTRPGTIISLQNAPDAPAPTGLQGVLDAVTNANAFRDMAALAGTQANAAQALQTAAGLATNFGNQAAALKLAELAKNAHDAQTADQKLATVARAVDKNLTTPEDAQRHTSQILESLHGPAAPSRPHEDATLARAISAATGQPGSSIEATTAEGQVKVSMGDSASPGAASGASEPDMMVTPLAWLEDHGAELAEDAMFDRGENTLPALAFVEGEHLNIGQSIMATVDAWAMAGLINGGAMIDVRLRSNGIASVPAALHGLKVTEEVLQILLTNGRFLEMALRFSPLNWDTFESGYSRALDELKVHLSNPLPAPSIAPIPAEVLARVAFSLHYLTDAFSAGHMRVPRAALGMTGPIAAKVMHDLEGRVGLTVGNVFGDIWRANGDGYLRGPKDAEVKEMHQKFAPTMTNGDVDANYIQVIAAVAEAVLLVHYHAQHWRESGNASGFPILDDARNAPNASTSRFLGADRAPTSSRFPTGTEWLSKSRNDILAYMRKHQPTPAAPGSWPAAMTNSPPLLDSALNIDGSGVYSGTGPFGKHRISVKLFRPLVIDFSKMYYLARVREASKSDIPGVPLDTVVLGGFNKIEPDHLKGHTQRPL
jgi:hypothetical protein